MRPVFTGFALSLALLPLAACGAKPESLAQALERAMEAGDADAALALARLEGAPGMLHSLFLRKVGDCAEETTVCRASVAPLDEKFAQQAKQMQEQGLEANVAPEGLVVVEMVEPNGKGTMRLPYAKIDGQYRIVSQRFTAAELAKKRAVTNASLLEKMLAQGIYDPSTGERRTDWKDGAATLPAGGGEVGEELMRESEAMVAAVSANDPDAAVASGDGYATQFLGPKDLLGKDVSMPARKLALRAHGVRMLRDFKVEGGFIKGDDAILLFEARDGLGWIERGAMLLSRDEGRWGKAGTSTVSYPAD